MINCPRIDLVAKKRSTLTDDMIFRLIDNFSEYNSREFTNPLLLGDGKMDGYRHLSVMRRDSDTIEVLAEAYSSDIMKIARMKLADYDKIYCKTRFATMILVPNQHRTFSSVSGNFPYAFASIKFDMMGEGLEDTISFVYGSSMDLIKLNGLLKDYTYHSQQELFRIIPYFDGPSKVKANHFTYSAFKNLTSADMFKAFSMAKRLYGDR